MARFLARAAAMLIVSTCGLLSQSSFAQSPQPAPSPPNAPSVEDEVLENIRLQPVGTHTLRDYHIPEPFLRRIADRVIRAAYQDRFRIVVSDTLDANKEPMTATRPADVSAPRTNDESTSRRPDNQRHAPRHSTAPTASYGKVLRGIIAAAVVLFVASVAIQRWRKRP